MQIIHVQYTCFCACATHACLSYKKLCYVCKHVPVHMMYIHNYILNLMVFVDEAKAMLDEDEEQFEKENIFREVDFNFSFFAKF